MYTQSEITEVRYSPRWQDIRDNYQITATLHVGSWFLIVRGRIQITFLLSLSVFLSISDDNYSLQIHL